MGLSSDIYGRRALTDGKLDNKYETEEKVAIGRVYLFKTISNNRVDTGGIINTII